MSIRESHISYPKTDSPKSYSLARNGSASISEVVEQGVDVAKMDAKLLQKIEELTLYSIQLERELIMTKQYQNAKIAELEKLVKQLLERK